MLMRKRRKRMGKIEERDALLSFAKKHIPLRPRRTFMDILLYPVRAFKNWRYREDLRKRLMS